MKDLLVALGLILIVYAIAQTFYTGFFSYKSRSLVKTTYVGQKTLGNPEKPTFKLFIDGDSVGAGVGASSFEKSVGGRIVEFYAKGKSVNFINNSVSGSTMETLVNKTIPSEKQDTTVLIVSSNNLFHFSNIKQFEESTEEVLKNIVKILRS